MSNFFAFDTETIKGTAFMYSLYSAKEKQVSYLHRDKDVIDFFNYCIDNYTEGWAWNLDYDALAFLKWLPESILTEIYFDKEIKVCNIYIKYIQGKRMELRRKDGDKWKYCTLYDISQFYNRIKLDTAAKKYLGVGGKIDIKKKGINVARLEWYISDSEKMDIIREYCLYDSELTYKLTEKLKEAAAQCELNVNNFSSPGSVAWQYMTKFIKVPPCSDPEQQAFVKRGYFGGRIEFLSRGTIKKLYMYDITSAYPYAMTLLKKIVDTKFLNHIDPKAEYFFAECSFTIPEDILLSPIAYRIKGLVTYPTGTFKNAVIDNITYKRIQKLTKDIKITRVLNVYTENNYLLRDFVRKTFRRRNDGLSQSIIFKMILNSLYGKFVERSKIKYKRLQDYALAFALKHCNNKFEKDDYESKYLKKCTCECKTLGYVKRNCKCPYCIIYKRNFYSRKDYDFIFGEGIDFYTKERYYAPHTNIIYGALITSYIRNYMYDIARVVGEKNVIGFMTDCIITTKPVPKKYIDNSKKLGKLEEKYKGNAYILGSGIYEYGETCKIRGFDAPVKLTYIAGKNKSKERIAVFSRIKKGISSMVTQGVEKRHINLIESEAKYMNVNFDNKRIWARQFKNYGDSLKNEIKSKAIVLK